MEINEICENILEICENEGKPYKENKEHLLKFFLKLGEEVISKQEELVEIINLHKKLTGINNRKASYIEEKIAGGIITDLPFEIRIDDDEIPENETEVLRLSYDDKVRPALKMSSLLFAYGKEILKSKEEKSKRFKKRIKDALKLLGELNQIYILPEIKEIFKMKINDSDEDVQFFALIGLENYYAHKGVEKITKHECENLERIIETTTVRETAATCCQILINAGKMDEFGAIMRIDNWKERNWK